MRVRPTLLLLPASLFLAAACGGGAANRPARSTTPTTASEDLLPMSAEEDWQREGTATSDAEVATDTEVAAEAEADEAPRSTMVTDGEIAHATHTLNTIEIESAMVARFRAKSPKVKAYAEALIEEHGEMDLRSTAVTSRLAVSREENATSEALRANAERSLARLSGLRGGAFDVAYMEDQVAMLAGALDALDRRLIPGAAANAPLREMLMDVRVQVAEHLERARSIDTAINTASR